MCANTHKKDFEKEKQFAHRLAAPEVVGSARLRTEQTRQMPRLKLE
jgi:hypothetical protein